VTAVTRKWEDDDARGVPDDSGSVAELRIPRSTFYYWRQLGRGPKAIKLPNGDVRIRRRDLDAWIKQMEESLA
jgi:predicted DNA-binding transcriptional regulator AlpA